MFLAQYKVLRENGHSPSEAFNETVEEATQSLFPLIGKYGSAAAPAPTISPR
jgi:ketol-acid reductoisomerase